MAQGESRFDPNSRQVVSNEFKTAPSGEYILKSKANFRVACKDEEGAIPYVWGNVLILGTEDGNNGKPISMLLPMYLTLTPRKEDGKPAVDLAGGMVDLCQRLKASVPDTVKVKTNPATDDRGEVESLEAKATKEFLNSLGEFEVKAQVKLKPAKGGWPAKNEVVHFIDDDANHVG